MLQKGRILRLKEIFSKIAVVEYMYRTNTLNDSIKQKKANLYKDNCTDLYDSIFYKCFFIYSKKNPSSRVKRESCKAVLVIYCCFHSTIDEEIGLKLILQ